MNKLGSQARGYFLIVTGFLACPCHLPITLPILLALTAGTAFGAFLANNVLLIGAIATVYFMGAIALGLRYLGQEEKVCEMPEAKMSATYAQKRASDKVTPKSLDVGGS